MFPSWISEETAEPSGLSGLGEGYEGRESGNDDRQEDGTRGTRLAQQDGKQDLDPETSWGREAEENRVPRILERIRGTVKGWASERSVIGRYSRQFYFAIGLAEQGLRLGIVSAHVVIVRFLSHRKFLQGVGDERLGRCKIRMAGGVHGLGCRRRSATEQDSDRDKENQGLPGAGGSLIIVNALLIGIGGLCRQFYLLITPGGAVPRLSRNGRPYRNRWPSVPPTICPAPAK